MLELFNLQSLAEMRTISPWVSTGSAFINSFKGLFPQLVCPATSPATRANAEKVPVSAFPGYREREWWERGKSTAGDSVDWMGNWCMCVRVREREQEAGRERKRVVGLLFGKGANPITGSSASPVSSAELNFTFHQSLPFSCCHCAMLSPSSSHSLPLLLQVEGRNRQIMQPTPFFKGRGTTTHPCATIYHLQSIKILSVYRLTSTWEQLGPCHLAKIENYILKIVKWKNSIIYKYIHIQMIIKINHRCY